MTLMDIIAKGRKIVIGFIVTLLGLSIAITALGTSIYISMGETQEAIQDLIQFFIRFALEIVLCFFLYKGYRWARIVWLILTGVGVAYAFLLAIISGWYMLIFAAIFGILFVLLLSQPVVMYQKHKSKR